MEGRLTICNMAIEAGARAGLVAPDQITFDYVASGNRVCTPRKAMSSTAAMEDWKQFYTDEGASF